MYQLSICIPTYNRAFYLEKCLISINKEFKRLGNLKKSVEVLIFDNDSSDNTSHVIDKYKKNFTNFQYKKNKSNIGSDKNFVQCFNSASGHYILILCDDDQLLSGSLNFILKTTKKYNNTIGILYLKSFSYNNKEFKPLLNIGTYKRYNSKKFLNKLNIKLTFASSLVLKNSGSICSDKFIGSNLIHYNYAISTLVKENLHILSSKYYVISKRENSGEYDTEYNIQRASVDISKVFIEQFLESTKKFVTSKKNYKKFKKKLFFNYIIYQFSYNSNSVLNSNQIHILDKYNNDLYSYKYFLKFLLKHNNRFTKYILILFSLVSRVLDGEFLKIINYFLYNSKNFKNFKNKEIPSILLDGFNKKKAIYKSKQLWKEGSHTQGNGFCRGGMYWSSSKGTVSIPDNGYYLINWHSTPAKKNLGFQRWKITITSQNGTKKTYNNHTHIEASNSFLITLHLKRNDEIDISSDDTKDNIIIGLPSQTYLLVTLIGK